ncbi:MAG: hypothetical protein ACOYI3_07450 [Christensenellales bacterium]
MENEEKIFSITADEVTVEVTDRATGRTFRRTLPIDYLETSNCLRLRGENMDGKPSELVFFSDAGVSKLRDLTGKGPDKSPCKGH